MNQTQNSKDRLRMTRIHEKIYLEFNQQKSQFNPLSNDICLYTMYLCEQVCLSKGQQVFYFFLSFFSSLSFFIFNYLIFLFLLILPFFSPLTPSNNHLLRFVTTLFHSFGLGWIFPERFALGCSASCLAIQPT